MFKADEVGLLDKTIKAFGPHSYIGPWLADYRLEIVRAIGDDVPIAVPMPNEAKREALDILALARGEAKKLVDEARATATRELEAAYTKVSETRRRAAAELERLARTL